MNKYLLLILLSVFGKASFAQDDTTRPVYLRFPTIPPFTIYKAADSSAFTREDLQKRKSTVFMIFSPECEHCQHETEALIKEIDKFKNAQIIMIDYLPHDVMVKFYKDYKIANYPVITMGRDAKFFFPIFFQVKSLPAIYVYDKKGKFKQAFEGSVKIEKIAEAL